MGWIGGLMSSNGPNAQDCARNHHGQTEEGAQATLPLTYSRPGAQQPKDTEMTTPSGVGQGFEHGNGTPVPNPRMDPSARIAPLPYLVRLRPPCSPVPPAARLSSTTMRRSHSAIRIPAYPIHPA